jgi:hypothetical protein
MTALRIGFSERLISRTIDWTILILTCLVVPYTHGYLQYLGLVAAAILLVAVKYVLGRVVRIRWLA